MYISFRRVPSIKLQKSLLGVEDTDRHEHHNCTCLLFCLRKTKRKPNPIKKIKIQHASRHRWCSARASPASEADGIAGSSTIGRRSPAARGIGERSLGQRPCGQHPSHPHLRRHPLRGSQPHPAVTGHRRPPETAQMRPGQALNKPGACRKLEFLVWWPVVVVGDQ